MKVAVVQEPNVLLDRSATLDRVVATIAEAAASGATLVVFPEAYLGGYPAWTWRLLADDDAALLAALYARFIEEAVDPGAGDLDPVLHAAAEHGVVVVIGLNEIDRAGGSGTVYNSVATIGSDGSLMNLHRKLMPTGVERTIWGAGDARGLRVVETPAGRIGTLICWEAYMPLSRFALYAEGVDILVVPTWDREASWLASMRHIAKEGACWVISTATSLRFDDIPTSVPGVERWARREGWICEGQAMVVRPFGRVIAGPLPTVERILYAEVDKSAARKARRMLDVAGHYSRPDIFSLRVDRAARQQVRFGEIG